MSCSNTNQALSTFLRRKEKKKKKIPFWSLFSPTFCSLGVRRYDFEVNGLQSSCLWSKRSFHVLHMTCKCPTDTCQEWAGGMWNLAMWLLWGQCDNKGLMPPYLGFTGKCWQQHEPRISSSSFSLHLTFWTHFFLIRGKEVSFVWVLPVCCFR